MAHSALFSLAFWGLLTRVFKGYPPRPARYERKHTTDDPIAGDDAAGLDGGTLCDADCAADAAREHQRLACESRHGGAPGGDVEGALWKGDGSVSAIIR